jgi:hypothetical protein
MTQINTLLARVEKKLSEHPDLFIANVQVPSPRHVSPAYTRLPQRVQWEEDQSIYPDRPPSNIKAIVAALVARHKGGQAFGPIENAALTFIAGLTGSERVVKTVVIAECRFRFPPLLFDVTRKGLRCWLGINWESFPSDLRGELLEERVLELQVLERHGPNGNWPKELQVSGKICFQLELRAAEPAGAETVRQALASLYAQFLHDGNPASVPLYLAPTAFSILSTKTN